MRLDREPFLFRIVPWFIGIVFVLIVLSWIAFGVIAWKATNELSESINNGGGIKALVEKVWCGAQGCK